MLSADVALSIRDKERSKRNHCGSLETGSGVGRTVAIFFVFSPIASIMALDLLLPLGIIASKAPVFVVGGLFVIISFASIMDSCLLLKLRWSSKGAYL